jgi:serine/threonine-protein kinase
MHLSLQITDGPHQGRSFAFHGHETFLAGRSRRAHLRLPTHDLYFSRVHFLVEVNPPNCRLMDLGSRNGTFVNGKRVEIIDLRDGDTIRAGHTVFRLELTPGFEALPTLAPSADPPPRQPSPARETPPALPPGSPDACRVCRGAGAEPASVPGIRLPDILHGKVCASCQERTTTLRQNVPGYFLLRELGRGTMGVVYLAAREQDGHLVAVKAILPAVDAGEREVQKFLREANILKELRYPHIVRFLDMGSSDGLLWMAMEHVPGTDAARLLKRHGPLPVARAVDVVCQLLRALEYAHGRGFVHRDIKPANLLVTWRDGKEHVLLADFGLARVYHASQLSGLTMTGAVGGTPMFMPPEQITHYREAQPAADQYAAAMTLYNLLTGAFGFDMPAHFREWIPLILEEDPVPIRQRRPDIPPALADIVRRALSKEPADRFPDVGFLRHALEPFLALES